jgi:hypothetical protein
VCVGMGCVCGVCVCVCVRGRCGLLMGGWRVKGGDQNVGLW